MDPIVSGLLLGLGVVGLLVEMQTLHGVAGLVGVAALALFFGAHVAGGPVDGLVPVLAIAGVLGIALELHVVPGHGVPGVLGAFALVAAVVLAFGAPFGVAAVPSLAIAIVVGVALYVLATRIFPRNAFAQRLTFLDSQGASYVASPDYRMLVGHQGVAASFLRPAGVAAIDGERVDVLTEGEFIAAGSPVVVTRVEGARIFVRAEGTP